MLISVELHVMQIEQTNFKMFSYFIKLSRKTEAYWNDLTKLFNHLNWKLLYNSNAHLIEI